MSTTAVHHRDHSGSRHRRRAPPTWRAPSGWSATPRSRGAQIVCLKELFNAPYFCKSQQCERFDLAEPIPGPTTEAMQPSRARAGDRHRRADVRAAGARRLPELGGGHRRRRQRCSACIARCTSPTIRCSTRSTTSRRGTTPGFQVWKTRYATIGVLICWDQWYPEAARITSLMGAQVLFYPTAIGWHPSEQDEWGAGAGRRVADDSALARDRQRRLRRRAQPHRPRRRAGHRRSQFLRPLVHRRSVRPLPGGGRRRRSRCSSRAANRR